MGKLTGKIEKLAEKRIFSEHAKWVEKKKPIISEYKKTIEEMLSSAGARGFSLLPGNMRADIVEMSVAAKSALSSANMVIYDEHTKIAYDEETWMMRFEIEYEKLLFKQYADKIARWIEWELEVLESQARKDSADIERLKLSVEARNAELIHTKAETEHQLNLTKHILLEAEKMTLPHLSELIEIQKENVKQKEEMIEPLLNLINEELLIIKIEEDKIKKLGEIVEIEKRIALILKTLIPFYKEKGIETDKLRQEMVGSYIAQRKSAIRLEWEEFARKAEEIAIDKLLKKNERELREKRAELDGEKFLTAEAIYQTRKKLTTWKTEDLEQQLASLRKNIEEGRLKFKYDEALDRKEIDSDSIRRLIDARKLSIISKGDAGLLSIHNVTEKEFESFMLRIYRYQYRRQMSSLEHRISKTSRPPTYGPLWGYEYIPADHPLKKWKESDEW